MRVARKRVAIASAIFLAVIFGGGLLLTTGLPGVVAMFLYAGVYQSLFPSSVTWDSHGAYVKCESAIADAWQWPAAPAKACQAMHMCANEATLSDRQSRALAAQIQKTPGCQIP
jgi:hypothetical protein